ncbi:hypothetical protein [Pandoraea sp.]|uniref:hypothetical protein n=1 Tax=Pandoraea sp. TaxID=1883445 RepID=UPI00121AEFC4|nr:hypothetical protein [Pandoraea sp.]TAL57263.1 MAG: hypothetical protein EPN80_00365 [Pandoraea sp.]TAM16488.1 MAG: hypothetical protein EPN65_14415 [Pandoraea sp.]
MAYELNSLLMKCEADDFSFLIDRIESFTNLSSDTELNEALGSFKQGGRRSQKESLAKTLEREIRYLGSSDIAYAYRKLTSSEEPAGVSIHEIIEDVSKKLKVRQKLIGGVEAKLERLVKFTVEKMFFELKPEQQREMFDKAGVGKDQQDEFFDKIKKNKAYFLPILFSLLGPEITATIVQGLAVAAIAAFIGRKAAEELLKNLIARFPWWAEWLGPIVWGLSLGWLAIDLQGAANRKTIPVLLYLGIVGLRDGPEDGDAFWSEPSSD